MLDKWREMNESKVEEKESYPGGVGGGGGGGGGGAAVQDGYGRNSAYLFAGYPPWMFYSAAGCCALFMLIGIPGNLITIAALFRTKRLRNATAVFIMNLSVSDLMFCCFNLPLAMSTFLHGGWIHGALLCRLYPLLRYGLVAVSLFTVLAITINRYIMIGHPRFYPKLYKSKYLGLMVLTTWLGGFGALLPTWFEQWGRFGLDPVIGSCSILPDHTGRNPKEFLFIMAFLTPCIAIIVCYARIFCIVRKTAFKSRRPDNVARQLVHLNVEISGERAEDSKCGAEGDSAIGSMSCLQATATSENRSPLQPQEPASRGSPRSWLLRELRKLRKLAEPDRQQQQQQPPPSFLVPELRLSLDHGSSGLRSPTPPAPHLTRSLEHLQQPPGLQRPISCSHELLHSHSLRRTASSSSPFLSPSPSFRYEEEEEEEMVSDEGTSSCSNYPMTRLQVQREERRRRGRAKEARFAEARLVLRRRESRFHGAQASRGVEVAKMSDKDKKLLKMILVIFSSFIVCYLPITISKTFKSTIDWRVLNIAGYILIYMTTCINPFIYVIMSSEYRSAYKNVLLCRNDSSTVATAAAKHRRRRISQRRRQSSRSKLPSNYQQSTFRQQTMHFQSNNS